MHAAAAAGQLEVVESLLDRQGTDPQIVDELGQTALFYAAFHGHLEVVQAFVERGVPLDMQDKVRHLPIKFIVIFLHSMVVWYIMLLQ